MTFKEWVDKLKGTTKGRLIAMGLILLINTAVIFLILFVIVNACLMILILPLTIFGIQYLFGERELKWLIIVGLIILLFTGLIFGAATAYQYYAYSPEPLEAKAFGTTILSNGKVDPKSGYGAQSFNFTVIYTDPGGPPSSISVNVYSPYTNLNETYAMLPADNDTNTADGKKYYYETTLPEDLHFFAFMARNYTGVWGNTTGSFGYYEMGPVNYPLTEFMIYGLYNIPFLAMIYFLFIMMYWWTQKARTYAPPPPKPEKEGEAEAEFSCSKCGADVPGDAKKCPNCGEEFEEDEEEAAALPTGEAKEKMEKGRLYCKVCNNNIKKGDMILGCQCGRYYHLRCAQEIGRCPHCGTDFKKD